LYFVGEKGEGEEKSERNEKHGDMEERDRQVRNEERRI
jgi:hypothetical protein